MSLDFPIVLFEMYIISVFSFVKLFAKINNIFNLCKNFHFFFFKLDCYFFCLIFAKNKSYDKSR